MRDHQPQSGIATKEILLESQHWIETYKSLFTLSIEGLKFSAYANGGAAVALLAYLGSIAGKNMQIPDMRWAMASFLAGLTCCGIAWGLAYLTQLKLLDEIGRTKEFVFKHTILLRSAISFFAFSIMAFAFGSWQAIKSFNLE